MLQAGGQADSLVRGGDGLHLRLGGLGHRLHLPAWTSEHRQEGGELDEVESVPGLMGCQYRTGFNLTESQLLGGIHCSVIFP